MGDIDIPADFFILGQEDMVFEIQHPRGGVCSLEKFSHLEELPAFAVRHRGVGDALEGVEIFYQGAIESDRALAMRGARVRALEVEVETVEALPHFAGDLLADGAGVFAGVSDRSEDRAGVGFFESDEFHHGIASDFFLDLVESFLVLQRGEDGNPLLIRVGIIQRLEIEHELHIHIKDAGAGLGALDVAAQPKAGIGDAAQHYRSSPSSRTQVSFVPPPCEEFTTREPFRMATRVSPPGMMVVFSPMRM